jgi:hypothetical protein
MQMAKCWFGLLTVIGGGGGYISPLFSSGIRNRSRM